ncbi:hypothetical protein [Halosimplex marinum]|uniref:hypothetical protein n=1 Tax=Halosimplex marinum TaxID=3396620 RepID=UPI003F570A20
MCALPHLLGLLAGLLCALPHLLGLLVHLLCLGLLAELLLARLLGLLGLLVLLLTLLTTALLGLLAALAAGRQELPRLGVTGTLLGHLAHPLAKLLGVAAVLCALVGAPALLTRETCLLSRRLLGGRDVPLLLLGLLAGLLAHLLGRLLVLLAVRSLSSALISEAHDISPVRGNERLLCPSARVSPSERSGESY